MKKVKIQLVIASIILMMIFSKNMSAQNSLSENQSLTARQQSLVAISALTAKGDLEKLKTAIGNGLDAKLTVNEIKEELVQLYAYCGFPRSLNGINTLIAVLEDRKQKGITDEVGRSASPVPERGSKYERGKKVLETLNGKPEPAQKIGFAAFSPEIDVFLKEHLFADIFERDVLSYHDREITTISALISLGNVESQLKSHMGIGLNVGVTEAQQKQILDVIESNIGKKEAEIGRKVLAEVIAAGGK